MKTLENYLEGFKIIEKRSALYYLTRYIKQAKAFENYKKEIFEDGLDSKPSEKIKALTLEMINFIEDIANKKASEFNDDEFIFWMDNIAEVEDTIDEEPDQKQLRNAIEALEKFDAPSIKKNKY